MGDEQGGLPEPESIDDVPARLEAVDGARLVGLTREGDPVYYDSDERRFIHGERRDGRFAPDWTTERYLPEAESPGDTIQQVADAVGWQALTRLGDDLTEQ